MNRFLLLPAFVFLTSGALRAVEFHVAPIGNDAWSGRFDRPNAEKTDGPLSSMAGARDAVRRWKAQANAQEPVRVFFSDGTYTLSEPVVFMPEDGGSASAPISYEAASGARPVISGGRRITGFKEGANGVWSAEVPEAAAGGWQFEQLWVNGQLATRARMPKTSWYQAVGPAGAPIAGVPLAAPLEKSALVARPQDVADLAMVPSDEINDVNVVVFHSWNTSRHRLAGVDAKSGALQFTGPARWSFFQSEPFHRLVFENYRAALTAPGEWFLDRRGRLFYIPRPGEDIGTAEIVAPATPHWLLLEGDAEGQKQIEHLQFRGLQFEYSQFVLPPEGWSDPQADSNLGAAIEADGATNVGFENCEFARTGNYVLWFRRGCSDSRVTHCYLHDLCAGGVRIGETSAVRGEAGRTGRISVENCIIQGGGRYFPGSVGVLIGHSGDNSIVHNDIGDFYYTAISMGWVWGFSPSVAVRNRIEWNHLHHLGWGVLSDMGAVYSLGVSPGTVVRHNRIHDVSCYSYGGWGLYPDEGSTGILYENNLVYRTESGGFHQHYGKENLVRNNIFAFGHEMQLRHTRAEDHLAVSFERNILVWDEGKLLGQTDASWRGAQVRFDHNLYWRFGFGGGAQPGFDFGGQSWEQWRSSGQDEGSLIADPLFVAPESGDFHLKPGSPAEKIGFVPFEYEKAGVEGDGDWKKLAEARKYPPMDLSPARPETPPLIFHDGFEAEAVGAGPRIAHADTGGVSKAIRVVAGNASAGQQCLEVDDGPNAKPSWNPHFYYRPNHRQGISRVTFDLRAEPTATIVHEWRDSETPYHVGPRFEIDKNWLSADGKRLMQIPAGEWAHFEIEAGMGEKCTRLWSLKVTMHGQPQRRFDGLKFVNPEMNALLWLGFSNPGVEPARWWLDELDIAHED